MKEIMQFVKKKIMHKKVEIGGRNNKGKQCKTMAKEKYRKGSWKLQEKKVCILYVPVLAPLKPILISNRGFKAQKLKNFHV